MQEVWSRKLGYLSALHLRESGFRCWLFCEMKDTLAAKGLDNCRLDPQNPKQRLIPCRRASGKAIHLRGIIKAPVHPPHGHEVVQMRHDFAHSQQLVYGVAQFGEDGFHYLGGCHFTVLLQ